MSASHSDRLLKHVSISNCAASMCIFSQGRLKGFLRLFLISIWTILFIAYFSVFASQLQKWDNDVPLHCYDTKALSLPKRPHPYMDNVYVIITFFTALGSINLAGNLAIASLAHEELLKLNPTRTKLTARFEKQRPLLIQIYRFVLLILDKMTNLFQVTLVQIALLQCPVHIWSIFALRFSNTDKFDDGSVEQEWGFGQIVAMVLVGATLFPIVDGVTGTVNSGEELIRDDLKANLSTGYSEEQAKKRNTTTRGQQTEDVEHDAAESVGVTGTSTPRPSGSAEAVPPGQDPTTTDQQAEAGDNTTTIPNNGHKPTTSTPATHDPSVPSDDSSQHAPSEANSPVEQADAISKGPRIL
jgi:hypothetical protein